MRAFVTSKPTEKEIERVAVYAYCLTHFRDTPEFNGRSLDALRKEVRGLPFSNIRVHVDNASKAGYLTTIGGGRKALTARGEALVRALPDRAAVAEALKAQPARGRRRGRRKAKKGGA